MNFVTPNTSERSPYWQLVLLFIYSIFGALLFSACSLAIIWLFYGKEVVEELMSSQISESNVNAFKILQTISTPIGMMLVPALLLATTERKKIKDFYPFKKPVWVLMGITILIMLISNPLLEYSALLNQKMILPDFLKNLELWMKEKEDGMALIMNEMIKVNSVWGFFINLVVIAAFPAIGEELMFRGGVQRAFYKMYRNHHVAIWLSAIIFSAIHLQFYGFLPRMLLGAGFGYLCYFGGSLWYAILAHFINNGVIVCITYYMQLHNIPLDKAEDPIGFTWYLYLISAILTIALFKFFKEQVKKNER